MPSPRSLAIALVCAALPTSLHALPAAAQASFAPSVTFTTPYVFRGAVFSPGLTVQPTLELRYGPAFVGGFANADPNGTATGRTLVVNEADLYAGVAYAAGPATVGMVYTFYTFPSSTASGLAYAPTNEVAVSARLNTPLSPGVMVAYDFDGDEAKGDLKGVYAEGSLSQTVGAGPVPLTVGALVALDAGYLLPQGEAAVAFATLSVGTTLPAGRATVSPKLSVQVSFADAYRSTFAKPSVFYGGVTVAF